MIDVVPLSEELSEAFRPTIPDNSENGSINAQNAKNAPIMPENAPIMAENPSENALKRRGRPPGVKDAQKRKTPVRQKGAAEAAAPAPPEIVEAASVNNAPKKPKTQRKSSENAEMSPAEPPLTASQLLRHLQNERRAHLDDHWSKVISPMFVR